MQKTGAGLKSIVARTALVLGLVAAACFTGAAWLIQQKAAAVQEATEGEQAEQGGSATPAAAAGGYSRPVSDAVDAEAP